MSLKITFSGKEQLSSNYFEPTYLKSKFELFKDKINDDSIGFFHISSNKSLIEECEAVYQKFQDRTTFVHVGIGGLLTWTRNAHFISQKEQSRIYLCQ